MKSKGKFPKTVKSVLLLLLVVGLAACQVGMYGQGLVASPENRIELLEGGPHSGGFETSEFGVVYSYSNFLDSIKMSGEVKWEERFTTVFPVLKRFNLRVHFLNAEGRVLQSKTIATAPFMTSFYDLRFEHRLKLPPDTAAMVFSYRGQAMANGWQGETWDFWNAPFH